MDKIALTVENLTKIYSKNKKKQTSGRALNNLSFEVEGRLGSGGEVSINGELTHDSLVEIYSVFEKVEMATFSPYAPSELSALEGLLSGGVSFFRESEDRIEFDLDLESGKLQIEDIKMSGFW